MSVVAVAMDAGDGGTCGSGLRQEGISKGQGEKKMKYLKSQTSPSFYNPSKAVEESFSLYVAKFSQTCIT